MTAPTQVTASQMLMRYALLPYRPAPLYFHKPGKERDGVALKIQIRLEPSFRADGHLTPPDSKTTGVFILWAPQKPDLNDNGFAQFDYENGWSAKLGRPDLSQLITAIRCRQTRQPVPGSTGDACDLFHSFGEGAERKTTTMRYQLVKDAAFFSIKKTKTGDPLKIRLSLAEEVELEIYLTEALRLAQRIGKR